MDRTKLAVLEMLGAQEPTPRHLLRRLEKLRSIIQNHENPPGCRCLLSTIHSAKGLEYDRVILLDVLDGILPAKPELCCRTPGETQQYEEDRRLFYVAMTRARHAPRCRQWMWTASPPSVPMCGMPSLAPAPWKALRGAA